jgi:hypothetical protein
MRGSVLILDFVPPKPSNIWKTTSRGNTSCTEKIEPAKRWMKNENIPQGCEEVSFGGREASRSLRATRVDYSFRGKRNIISVIMSYLNGSSIWGFFFTIPKFYNINSMLG